MLSWLEGTSEQPLGQPDPALFIGLYNRLAIFLTAQPSNQANCYE